MSLNSSQISERVTGGGVFNMWPNELLLVQLLAAIHPVKTSKCNRWLVYAKTVKSLEGMKKKKMTYMTFKVGRLEKPPSAHGGRLWNH